MCFPIFDTKAVYFYSYGQQVAMTTHSSQRLICWNLSKIISYQRDNIDFSELTTQIFPTYFRFRQSPETNLDVPEEAE